MNYHYLYCRVEAELNAQQAKLGHAASIEASLEQRWAADFAADKKIEILMSIGKPADQYDFEDFICDHEARESLTLIGLYAVQPQLKPADWNDTQSVVHEARVAAMLEEFVEMYLEIEQEKWIQDELDFPSFNEDY